MSHSTTDAPAVQVTGFQGRGLSHPWLLQVDGEPVGAYRTEEEAAAALDGPSEADRAWAAAQTPDSDGLTARDEERTALELWTVSALDWTLEQIPAAEWDRWAEGRQIEWGAC